VITGADRYGDLDIEDLDDDNKMEDGESFFELEPDNCREVDFGNLFEKGEVRSFDRDFEREFDYEYPSYDREEE
jgi:hypothetical protein